MISLKIVNFFSRIFFAIGTVFSIAVKYFDINISSTNATYVEIVAYLLSSVLVLFDKSISKKYRINMESMIWICIIVKLFDILYIKR